MDLGALEALANGVIFDTMGVSATITRPSPDDTPITTSVVWMTPTTDDDLGGAFTLQHRDATRILAVRVADVPTLPKGSIILAPLSTTGAVRRWRVDGVDRAEDTIRRYIVVPNPDPNTTEPSLP